MSAFESALADAVHAAALAQARSLDALCWDAYMLQGDGQQWRLQVIERHSLGDPIAPTVASDVADLVKP